MVVYPIGSWVADKVWVLCEACVGFVEIRCVRVFFNPCPSFLVAPVGTDLLECKQPWITVGSLFPLHKATKPWEQPFTQLVVIRIYDTVTATQPQKLSPNLLYL